MRTHTGNKPYICLYYSDSPGKARCTKTFARSDERVRHHSTLRFGNLFYFGKNDVLSASMVFFCYTETFDFFFGF